jgi:hypothetical protein
MTLQNSTIREIVEQAKILPANKLAQAEKTAQEMSRSLTQVLIEKNLVKESQLGNSSCAQRRIRCDGKCYTITVR